MAYDSRKLVNRSWGLAWFALCAAFAVHVADEAFNDFLSVYNPIVTTMAERWPFLAPAPLSFEFWIARLILALVALFLLTPLVLKGLRWMMPIAYVFAAVMEANGVWRIAGLIYLRRFLPGLYSSALLLTCSAWLFLTTLRESRRRRAVEDVSEV